MASRRQEKGFLRQDGSDVYYKEGGVGRAIIMFSMMDGWMDGGGTTEEGTAGELLVVEDFFLYKRSIFLVVIGIV